MPLVNLNDKRRNRTLWLNINAVATPTWHDNKRRGADKAEGKRGDWGYKELRNTSIAKAIVWANELPGETTLSIYALGEELPGQTEE